MLGVYSFYVSSKNFLFIMLTPAGDKKNNCYGHIIGNGMYAKSCLVGQVNTFFFTQMAD